MSKTVFEKVYDGESIVDLQRDIFEAMDPIFNPLIDDLPVDEHGFIQGNFKVQIIWENEDEQ